MREDPLLGEICAVRHRISERFGHNAKALCDRYREMGKKHPDRMPRDHIEMPVAKSEK